MVSVTVQDASAGDPATLRETLVMPAEQVEAAQPAARCADAVVAGTAYHSDETLVGFEALGIRSYVSEPKRGRHCWKSKESEAKRAAQKALYANRRRVRGERGHQLPRRPGELGERPFAHRCEPGRLRRAFLPGEENARKSRPLQPAGCNPGLLLRRLTAIGTPRRVQGWALEVTCGPVVRSLDRWARLTRLSSPEWLLPPLAGSDAHR